MEMETMDASIVMIKSEFQDLRDNNIRNLKIPAGENDMNMITTTLKDEEEEEMKPAVLSMVSTSTDQSITAGDKMQKLIKEGVKEVEVNWNELEEEVKLGDVILEKDEKMDEAKQTLENNDITFLGVIPSRQEIQDSLMKLAKHNAVTGEMAKLLEALAITIGTEESEKSELNMPPKECLKGVEEDLVPSTGLGNDLVRSPKGRRQESISDTVSSDENQPTGGIDVQRNRDDETDLIGEVWDIERQTIVRRRIVWPTSMHISFTHTKSGWIFEKIFGDSDFMAAGQLLIPPCSSKPRKATRDNTYFFFRH